MKSVVEKLQLDNMSTSIHKPNNKLLKKQREKERVK
jgi:hypothetical protein